MRTAPLLLFATAASLAAPSQGAPWQPPGDARARYAAQTLADTGRLNRTTSTWPLMWANLDVRRDAAETTTGTAHAYLAFERQERAQQGLRTTLTLTGASEQRVLRDFNATPDESAQLDVTLQWQGEHWAAGLSPSHTQNPQDGKDWRLDGSYLAATAGNWVIGAGNLDRWWGPGWQSSLVLSNNARPLPAVWLNRRDARPPQNDWLNWIGPWDVTLLAAETESGQTDPEAQLMGMRLTVRPIHGLDIGFSRLQQVDGKHDNRNSAAGGETPAGNDNRREDNAPGDQLGALDIRYGFQASATTTLGLYTQVLGEDEVQSLLDPQSRLVGIDATSALAGGEQQWYLEHTNTMTDDGQEQASQGRINGPSFQQTAYHYRGRSIGASQYGNGDVTTLGGWHFLPSGSQIGASVTHLAPDANQDLTQTTLSFGTEILHGWLNVEASYASKPPMLRNGTELDQWQIGGEWRYRF